MLIELKTKVSEIDKRIEQIDKRFEQVDKRFAELRDDMNKRFEQMMWFMGILAAIFAAMTVGTIGFAIWDRRTMVRPFESKVSELDTRIIDNSKNHKKLIDFLKEYASKNKKFAETIRRFNLF